jgi:flagellar motor switch protein FliN
MSIELIQGSTIDVLLDKYQVIGDVEVTVCAEVDRVVIPVRKLMNLEVGSLLTLSRPAGENINLYIGDVLIANAEILVSDERIGVRIAELADRSLHAQRSATPEAAQKDVADEC